MDKLTATEKAVALLAAEGCGNKEIARTLHCGCQQVKNHLTACYRVLDLPANRNQRVLLTRLVIERGRTEGNEEGHEA